MTHPGAAAAGTKKPRDYAAIRASRGRLAAAATGLLTKQLLCQLSYVGAEIWLPDGESSASTSAMGSNLSC